MSTLQYAGLGASQYLPSSTGALLDNASGRTSYVTGIWVHNANTTTETIELWGPVPASGGALGTPNDSQRIAKETLTPDQSKLFQAPGLGWVLTAQHDSIQGKTTTGSKVGCYLFGDYAT